VAEHPNAALLREAISVFNRGDFDAYRAYFTEDVVWHVGGNHPLSGDYRGRDAIFEYFETVRGLTSGACGASRTISSPTIRTAGSSPE
jgi:ketosteroid isomerase-like protein